MSIQLSTYWFIHQSDCSVLRSSTIWRSRKIFFYRIEQIGNIYCVTEKINNLNINALHQPFNICKQIIHGSPPFSTSSFIISANFLPRSSWILPAFSGSIPIPPVPVRNPQPRISKTLCPLLSNTLVTLNLKGGVQGLYQ